MAMPVAAVAAACAARWRCAARFLVTFYIHTPWVSPLRSLMAASASVHVHVAFPAFLAKDFSCWRAPMKERALDQPLVETSKMSSRMSSRRHLAVHFAHTT